MLMRDDAGCACDLSAGALQISVTAIGTGGQIAGTTGIITHQHTDNGYQWYRVNGIYERQQDLRRTGNIPAKTAS